MDKSFKEKYKKNNIYYLFGNKNTNNNFVECFLDNYDIEPNYVFNNITQTNVHNFIKNVADIDNKNAPITVIIRTDDILSPNITSVIAISSILNFTVFVTCSKINFKTIPFSFLEFVRIYSDYILIQTKHFKFNLKNILKQFTCEYHPSGKNSYIVKHKNLCFEEQLVDGEDKYKCMTLTI